jgi:phosphohistidine phosphatase SixA
MQQQRVVVMRHGDRLDHAEPLWPATNPRPWDPPLSDAGLLRASTVGKRIRSAAAADGWAVHRVLVSPFLRCRQTAARAIAALCAVPDDSSNLPLDTSRLKVPIEFIHGSRVAHPPY